MSELLQEFVDSGHQTLRVDRAAGVIRGVKLLGLQSKNGRRYLDAALAAAAPLYEGAKVNINHPKGHPLAPRDYQDRLGVISQVEHRPQEGLFGDLHFNPKHPLSEQLMWDAEHASRNVGLSHNVLARTRRAGEETLVEAITKVQSIDLVADPATTQGLFEQASVAVAWDQLTLETLELQRPDLVAEFRAAQLAAVESQVAAAAAARAARHVQIDALLAEHQLPPLDAVSEVARQITSDEFVATLVAAENDHALRRLVEARAALVRSARRWPGGGDTRPGQPLSRDQHTCTAARSPALTAQEFAAAIRGR